MNSRIIFAGFAVAAGVALWLSQPGRIDALRNDQMSTRCAMIQAAITSLDRGELATVTESGDVSPDMPPTIWMNPVGQIIQDSAAPDRPISENDPYFYFGRHETGPFDRAGSLELNYFCSALCGQYWRLELARTREGWQVIDIQHTGSS